MKAIVPDRNSSPDLPELTDIDKPEPADDEVLLRVHAASANPADWHFLRGIPYIARMQFGLRKPNDRILGCDVAGRIEAVGNNVTMLRPGDQVFGSPFMHGLGAFAEWVSISEDLLAPKPAALSLSRWRQYPWPPRQPCKVCATKDGSSEGTRSEIGASGGVGTFAVQIASPLMPR